MLDLMQEPSRDDQIGRPTLLIDIGGTLVSREGDGPRKQVGAVLRKFGIRATIAGKVLTELQTATSFEGFGNSAVVAELSGVTRSSVLEVAWQACEVADTRAREGAAELLSAAHHSGWRVLACSDAVAWQSRLPDPLAQYIEAEIRSSTIGRLKSDPGFWTQVLSEYRVNPSHALVVGDHPNKDGTIPRSAGLCSAVLGPSLSLLHIAGYMRTLPPLQRHNWRLAFGPNTNWGGQLVADAPHLESLVERVTRARGVAISQLGTSRIVLSRRRAMCPVVIWQGPPVTGLCWIHLFGEQRHERYPTDMLIACRAAGVNLDTLNSGDRRHLISMVKEAKDPTVRCARIDDVVAYLSQDRRVNR